MLIFINAMKKSFIPINSLQERNSRGLEVKQISIDGVRGDIALQTAHRDDYYIFAFQEQGYIKMMIDFKEVVIEGSAILCVFPGQVHYGTIALDTKAWFIAMDVSWINENLRPVFDQSNTESQPAFLNADEAGLLKKYLLLLDEAYKSDKNLLFNTLTLHAMTDAYLSIFASFYSADKEAEMQSDLRTVIITRQFKKLLLTDFRTVKSPSAYAAALNISPSYLNEAVKKTTGSPVSYWIHQEILLEAKRMLFYTDHTVKEIAHNLGYDDHTYFIRIFSKTEGMAPLQFRHRHRK